MTNWKQRLIKRFHETKVVQFGDFTLSSGAKSHYYVDARKVTLDFFGLKAIIEGIDHITNEYALEYYWIGGPSIGADPIVGAGIAQLYDINGGFLVRPKQKDHGTKRFVEGNIGSKYILVEDVCTTGSSILHCLDVIEDIIKDSPIAIFSVLDRGSGIENWMHKGNLVPYFPLLKLEDLGIKV